MRSGRSHLVKNSQTNDPASLTITGRLRFLARDSAIYGMAAAVSRFASLLTFPIVVRHLEIAEYGALDIIQIFGNFLVVLLIFGQDSGVARYFFEYEDAEVRKDFISQSFFFRIYVMLIVAPLLWFLGSFIIGLLGIGQEYQPAFAVLLLQIPFVILLNFCVVLLRVTFSRGRFIFLSVGFSFTQAACWLVAIFWFDASVRGILVAGLLATLFYAAIGIFFIRHWLKPSFQLNYVLEMMPYSLPYGAISALRAIVPVLERSLVAILLTVDALGLYAASAKMTMFFAIFAYAFQSAWEPFALSIGKKPDAQATYNLVLKVFILLVCVLVLALTSVAKPMIVILASEKYAEAAAIVFPLMMAMAIESIGWITEIGLILQRRTSLKLIAYLLGTIISILGIVLLTPAFGLPGVATAVLIGNIVKTLAVTIFAQRVSDLKWDIKGFVVMLPVTLVGGVIISFVANENGLLAALGIFCLAMVLLLTLTYTLLLSPLERTRLASAIRRVLRPTAPTRPE